MALWGLRNRLTDCPEENALSSRVIRNGRYDTQLLSRRVPMSYTSTAKLWTGSKLEHWGGHIGRGALLCAAQSRMQRMYGCTHTIASSRCWLRHRDCREASRWLLPIRRGPQQFFS